jgi:hypothetical protein
MRRLIFIPILLLAGCDSRNDMDRMTPVAYGNINGSYEVVVYHLELNSQTFLVTSEGGIVKFD